MHLRRRSSWSMCLLRSRKIDFLRLPNSLVLFFVHVKFYIGMDASIMSKRSARSSVSLLLDCVSQPSKERCAFSIHNIMCLSSSPIFRLSSITRCTSLNGSARLARMLFNSMNQQAIALWGSESWAALNRSKLGTFHNSYLRRMCNLTMWDISEKLITNIMLRRSAANSSTMESMMEVRRWLS
jgi:hypothetical protein